MAKKKVRMAVPGDIRQQVMAEAGSKCGMPGCDTTSELDIHFIDGDSSHHDLDNLLVLCAHCRRQVKEMKIGREFCRFIKQMVVTQLPDATQSAKDDLERMRAGIIGQIEELVGRQDTPEPLGDDELGIQALDPRVHTAAIEAEILESGGIPLPIEVLRALVYELYKSDCVPQAVLLQLMICDKEGAGSEDHFNLGVLLTNADGKEDAEKAYRRAVEADPANAGAWTNLGILLAESDHKKDAEEAFRQAVNIDPSNSEAWYNLGITIKDAGNTEEAEAAYRKAVEADPELADAWYALGNLLSETERKDEGLEAFRKAAAVAPDDVDSRNGLAYCLWQVGRYDEAEEQARKALDADPRHPYANATLGLILFERNQIDEGRKRYERAIKINPEDYPLQQKYHYEYARALARNGYPSQARIELEIAKKIDTSFVPLGDIEAELAKLES